MIEAMQEAGYKITALDASQGMLEIAKQKHTDVNFIYSDFLDWESEEAFDLVVAWDSIFHAPRREQASILFKLCAHLAPEGILIFTGGDEDGDIQGSDMQGVPFEYGSISYMKRLKIIEQSHCDIFIMERDQPPHPKHMVFICKRRNDEQ